MFNTGLGQNRQIINIDAQAACAHRYLLQGFLACYVQHLPVIRLTASRLQQQRRFTDAWITADQHNRSGNQPASKHAVELRNAGRNTFNRRSFNIRQL
jgi:hypothetical protein